MQPVRRDGHDAGVADIIRRARCGRAQVGDLIDVAGRVDVELAGAAIGAECDRQRIGIDPRGVQRLAERALRHADAHRGRGLQTIGGDDQNARSRRKRPQDRPVEVTVATAVLVDWNVT